ncbi:hypothetical protein ACIREM_15500 [Streptomyces shenzhenensis]|uniref:hypothetical protein n=1 Tax=Streptomyces shenzhenensis TaxID=943815 RepID=UPI0037F7395C
MQASTTGAYVRDGRLNEADRFLVELPSFHTAGLGVTANCLRAGVLVLLARWRPSCWPRRETPFDQEHNVRLMVAAPIPPDLPREPGIAAAPCVGVDEADASGGEDLGGARRFWGAVRLRCAGRAARRAAPRLRGPRFYGTTDSLPTTPTQRVRKFELRRQGNGPEAWDRPAASRPAH